MDKMDTEDGNYFVKHLAAFIRTHEKALANALQLQTAPQRPPLRGGTPTSPTSSRYPSSPPATNFSTSSTLAAAFSLPSLSFTSQQVRPAKLSLTPHHLFYLLTRFEDLGIAVGPMNVRLESIHAETMSNYVSFLDNSQRARRSKSSDALSIRSVSSVKSVMSGMSSLWNAFGLGNGSSIARNEKTKAALIADLKFIYASLTKIPCLRLCPDPKARLIGGFEEFPFDTAVPLLCFKNLTALEINDIDIRQFYGWDQLAERLRSLVIRRGGIEDPAELIIAIVLDDMDKRRRRSSKNQATPINWSTSSAGLSSDGSVTPNSPRNIPSEPLGASVSSINSISKGPSPPSRSSSLARDGDTSPTRPGSSRNNSHAHRSHRMRRSDSGSSRGSSSGSALPLQYSGSSQGLNLMGNLPYTKWRFLKHLSLADNSLTSISLASLAPLANSLTSFDLSSNLFVCVPEALAALTSLRALNLSNNMIDSLHSLTRHPLPAITALNLRGNRLSSLAGIEVLTSLERLDVRENRLRDPTELARLTSALKFTEVWVNGNPFVKTHNLTYRVTIFDLFRKTPGYTDDISIDAMAPGMMERQKLTERASAPLLTPVVKTTTSMPPPKEIVRRDTDRQPPARQQSEKSIITINGSSEDAIRQKKKLPRRRVVELSRGEGGAEVLISPAIAPKFLPEDFEQHKNSNQHYVTSTFSPRPQLPASPPKSSRDKIHPTFTGEAPPTPPPKDIPRLARTSTDDWNQKGEEYRKKVEALKNEVGSSWLSVLGEEGWDNNKRVQTPPLSSRKSPILGGVDTS